MKNLAIITARSGSKGLPNKNILPICGKPLMWYSIKAALDSGMYDEVMVSTDSEKYAEIARECGAKVPFLRSEEMSSDTATSMDCVREVICEYKKRGMEFDTVTILQPTTPLRNAEHIKEAFRLKEETGREYVMGVIPTEFPMSWCFSIDEDGNAHYPMFDKSFRRQDAKVYYRPNGAMYIINTDAVVEKRTTQKTYYIMDQVSSVDIDSEVDFVVAEYYVKKSEENK